MKALALWNGQRIADADHALAVDDRGCNYGDGLFETALLRDGAVRFLEQHLARLSAGCQRLHIRFEREALSGDIAQVCALQREGVLKIVLTREARGRGYRADLSAGTNRLLTVHPMPAADAADGVVVRWCDMQLSRNPALAGIKHLNRLEQVLAQSEWQDEAIAEGLVCDTEGELISGTASNVFIVRERTLLTPDLRFCGVRGVMREQVLRVAASLGYACSEEPLWPHDAQTADEVFLTNAVRGIRPVASLGERHWHTFNAAKRLAQALGL